MHKSLPFDSISALNFEFQKSKSQQPKLLPSASFRDSLQVWLIDLFPEIPCQTHTKMLACSYLDRYMLSWPELNSELCSLAAVMCLGIALKFEQGEGISYDYIEESFGFQFTKELIRLVEFNILKVLNWKLDITTPASLIRMLLDVPFDENNHFIVADRAEIYGIVGAVSRNIAVKGEFFIAVAAVSLALKRCGHKEFLHLWWERVLGHFSIPRTEIMEIEGNIMDKMMSNKATMDLELKI